MVISVAVQMGSYFTTRTYLVMKFTMAQLFFLGILLDTSFNLGTEEQSSLIEEEANSL